MADYRMSPVGRVWREAFHLVVARERIDMDEILCSHFAEHQLDKFLSKVNPKLSHDEAQHLKSLLYLDDELNWGRMMIKAIDEIINKHTEQ